MGEFYVLNGECLYVCFRKDQFPFKQKLIFVLDSLVAQIEQLLQTGLQWSQFNFTPTRLLDLVFTDDNIQSSAADGNLSVDKIEEEENVFFTFY